MPKPCLNPRGRKVPLNYKIDPDLKDWLTANGKTATIELLIDWAMKNDGLVERLKRNNKS